MELPSPTRGDVSAGGSATDALSLVVHELRTPLTLIRGYVATLLHIPDLTDAERQQYLHGIDGASGRLMRLVDDILDMSLMETGRLTLHRVDDYLDRLARRVVHRMQSQTATHGLRIHAPRPLPALPLDSDRVEQVLANLIGNATKYTPDGSPIEVVVGLVHGWADFGRPWPGATAAPETAWQYVQVRDQGSGLAPDDLPFLFERFRRGSNPAHRAVPGAGLGLYICQTIVEAHGGAIWAENQAGGGSSFTFCLPMPTPSD
jgi:signal transduction histidine kinase